MALRLALALAALAASGWAQTLRMYSEFQRIDPFGAVVAADRAERPREILSPALARNAHATFQVVIALPSGEPYSLFAVQNPVDAVQVAAYRPIYVQRGTAWIPDELEPLKLSATRQILNIARQVPGQTATVVWLDLWVPANAPTRRTRFEVQLCVGDQWIVYPLELRIVVPPIPIARGPLEPLAPLAAPAAASAAGPLRAYLCGVTRGGEQGPLSIRALIRRNARQDVALARSLRSATLAGDILAALGGPQRAKWCQTPGGAPQLGAEWYLCVRDALYRAALQPIP
jgi:hypothetical protein